jgi:hypothetical protein
MMPPGGISYLGFAIKFLRALLMNAGFGFGSDSFSLRGSINGTFF